MCEIYLIIFSGFALLGLYCFVDTFLSVLSMSKFPPSVTVYYNSQDVNTFKKIKYAENNMPNNYNILYPFDDNKTAEEQRVLLDEYLKSVLIVNKQ